MLIYYKGAYYCVTYVQRSFTIDPCEEALIYKAWRTKAGKLRNMFYDICENDASTHWLTEYILQALRAYWDSLGYKMKQVKVRANRGTVRGGLLHTRVSTTIEGTQLRMVNIIPYTYLVI